ncbi:molecular chaperone [Buttiauxella noackiae]|uniref:fimbrial biogenesis chaperone n=1 Tax=Buttiauxella noackiae TaxID=82992 RepID=UPI0035A62D66
MNVWQKMLFAALWIVIVVPAQAGIVIGGTRVVFDGGKKESTLTISNPDQAPFLIQSWVDGQEGDTSKAPFIITPPIFRLDGGQDNLLRIISTTANLPTDKESLYWINIKSIPSSEKKENTLKIAVKSRIKLIYRPRGLPGDLNSAAAALKWQRNGSNLQVNNSSAYYITFFNIKMNGTPLKNLNIIAPQSSAQIALPSSGGGNLSWQIINDFGGASQVFNTAL